MKKLCGFLAIMAVACGVSLAMLHLASVAYGAAAISLPRDSNGGVVQAFSPSIPFGAYSLTKAISIDCTHIGMVRYRAAAATTYDFGANTGTAWPVKADTDEYIALPADVSTLRIFANISTAGVTVNVQAR